MDPDPDDPLIPRGEGKTFQKIVYDAGLEFLQYSVTTQDNYILTIFRIVDYKTDREAGKSSPRPAVFLQHGFGDSADAFVMHKKE